MIDEFKWALREQFGVSALVAALIVWGLLAGAGLALLVTLKSCYDNGVVEDEVNKANSEFRERQIEAQGAAAAGSAMREAEHNLGVKQTEELIDDALANGCAIPEYLASGGVDCVHG